MTVRDRRALPGARRQVQIPATQPARPPLSPPLGTPVATPADPDSAADAPGAADSLGSRPNPAGAARRRRPGRDHAAARRVRAVDVRLPAPIDPILFGGAGSTGGMIMAGVSGSAALLTTALVIWLLSALLGDRVGVDRTVYRSALVDLRLERPG